jgi:transposase
MRKPAHIRPWMSEKKLQTWVRKARSREEYQRRAAVWMTVAGPFPAHRIANLLVVSKQSVWLWVGQYNRLGPKGLHRRGRGGHRRAYLSPEQESALLESLQKRAQRGEAPTASQLQEEVSKTTRKRPSISFAYHLLDRIRGRKLDAQTRHRRISLND